MDTLDTNPEFQILAGEIEHQRASKTHLLHPCHLTPKQWKKCSGQLSCCFLVWRSTKINYFGGKLLFTFQCAFSEVAVSSPYLNFNIQMTATATLKRNIRCSSGSRRPILNSLIVGSEESFKTFDVSLIISCKLDIYL